MSKLNLCRLTLLAMLCAVTGGCGTSDICNVYYFKPSSRDTDKTQAQALAQNQFLKGQGCPERFSPLVGGEERKPAPLGLPALRNILPK